MMLYRELCVRHNIYQLFMKKHHLLTFQRELHLDIGRHPALSQPPGTLHPQEQDPRPGGDLLAQGPHQVEEHLAGGESLRLRTRRAVSVPYNMIHI